MGLCARRVAVYNTRGYSPVRCTLDTNTVATILPNEQRKVLFFR